MMKRQQQQRKKATPIKQQKTIFQEECQSRTKFPSKKLQVDKKRGSRVKIDRETNFSTSYCNGIRWSSKEINNLTMAMEFAVNPRSVEDWDKIAETVGKGCSRKRSGEECKLRAEKSGLMLTVTSSASYPINNNQYLKKSTPVRRAKSMKCIFNSESEESTSEIHRMHYDEFFAKQTSPITECLDMDDTLVRVCSVDVPTHPYMRLRNIRRPFMLKILSEDSARDDDGDCSASEIETGR